LGASAFAVRDCTLLALLLGWAEYNLKHAVVIGIKGHDDDQLGHLVGRSQL
jgi:hypothetical protein